MSQMFSYFIGFIFTSLCGLIHFLCRSIILSQFHLLSFANICWNIGVLYIKYMLSEHSVLKEFSLFSLITILPLIISLFWLLYKENNRDINSVFYMWISFCWGYHILRPMTQVTWAGSNLKSCFLQSSFHGSGKYYANHQWRETIKQSYPDAMPMNYNE